VEDIKMNIAEQKLSLIRQIDLLPEDSLIELENIIHKLIMNKKNIEKNKNQAEKLMAFAGKVKFDRDGLEYQHSLRDEWE
jgi:hypothetical protein